MWELHPNYWFRECKRVQLQTWAPMIWTKHWSQYATNLTKIWWKNCVVFCLFCEIFSVFVFSTQFLWYARPYYVGVEAQFLYLWVSEGVLLSFLCPVTCQTRPLMIWEKHCSHYATNLLKNGWKLHYFSWNIFGTLFSTLYFRRNYYGMPGHYMWELMLNPCLCDYQGVLFYHPLVQLSARNNLWWLRQSIGPNTQLTYQK